MHSRIPEVDVALSDLIGRPLTAVTFVMDYLQIAFDDAVLTILTTPELVESSRAIAWDTPAFAGVLRGQIGDALRRIDISDKKLRLSFENGISLKIPLEEMPPRVEHIIVEIAGTRVWVQ
jgi:hypothetical protein